MNTQAAYTHPEVGTPVEYVDPVGISHEALVTAVWGPELGKNAINLVFVVKDENKTDSCGRQIERATSVAPDGPQAAHGRYYKTKLRAVK